MPQDRKHPGQQSPQEEPPASEGGDFTRMFRSLSDPAPFNNSGSSDPLASTETKPAAPSSDFTQTFARIPRPTSAPPEISKNTPPPSSSSGEFTQLFSGLGSVPSEPRPQPSQSSLLEPFRPLTPSPVSPASPVDADVATKLFGRPDPASQLMGSAPPSQRSSEEPTSFGAPTQTGSFSRVFHSPPPPSRQTVGPSSSEDAFGRSQPNSAPQPSSPAPPGSYSQIFRSLSEPDLPAHAPLPPVDPGATASALPPLQAEAGDFTRLLRGLGESAPEASPQRSNPPGSFFPESASPATSEFSRIIRSSPLRETPRPEKQEAYAPPSPAASFVLPKLEPPAAAKLEKPNRLVLVLITLNIVLLLALVVLAIALLRRH